MTIEAFRKNEELVAWTAKLFRSRNWELLMQTLRDTHPMHETTPSERYNNDGATWKLGVIEGYNLLINKLETMGTPVATQEMPVATFEPPTIQ